MNKDDDAMLVEEAEEEPLPAVPEDVEMESAPPSRRMSVVVEVGPELPPALRAPTTEEGGTEAGTEVAEVWDWQTQSEHGCVYLTQLGPREEKLEAKPEVLASDNRSRRSEQSDRSFASTRKRPLVSAVFSLSGPGLSGVVSEPMTEWLNIRAVAESTMSAWGQRARCI
eukprot:GHVU01108070.1.p2 GENE.GHVU01108070.1~~GHVU01108070.1.p2  ORF type:complete len:169 (-),score=19.08 GHVU01108070.1:491-997(-)